MASPSPSSSPPRCCHRCSLLFRHCGRGGRHPLLRGNRRLSFLHCPSADRVGSGGVSCGLSLLLQSQCCVYVAYADERAGVVLLCDTGRVCTSPLATGPIHTVAYGECSRGHARNPLPLRGMAASSLSHPLVRLVWQRCLEAAMGTCRTYGSHSGICIARRHFLVVRLEFLPLRRRADVCAMDIRCRPPPSSTITPNGCQCRSC